MHIWTVLAALICGGCAGDRDADSERVEPFDRSHVPPIAVLCDSLGNHLDQLGFVSRVIAAEGSCSVEGELSLADFALDVDPLESLRDSLTNSGWIERLEFAADNAGTSSFQLDRTNFYCSFVGGAHASIDDDEIRQSDEYTVSVACRN